MGDAMTLKPRNTSILLSVSEEKCLETQQLNRFMNTNNMNYIRTHNILGSLRY